MSSGPLRTLSLLAGIVFLFLSIMFSANGLGFSVENRFAVLIGWIIGITFTVVEFVFNEEGVKHTSIMIILMGIFCYIYGIYTNIVGLLAWSGIPDIDAMATTVEQNPLKLVIPIVLALIFELGAEPLILWGLTGTGKDFLNGIMNMVPTSKKNGNEQLKRAHYQQEEIVRERERERNRQGY